MGISDLIAAFIAEELEQADGVLELQRRIEELQSGGDQLSLEDIEKTDEHSDGRDDD